MTTKFLKKIILEEFKKILKEAEEEPINGNYESDPKAESEEQMKFILKWGKTLPQEKYQQLIKILFGLQNSTNDSQEKDNIKKLTESIQRAVRQSLTKDDVYIILVNADRGWANNTDISILLNKYGLVLPRKWQGLS